MLVLRVYSSCNGSKLGVSRVGVYGEISGRACIELWACGVAVDVYTPVLKFLCV